MWLTLRAIAIELRPSAIQSMLFYAGNQTVEQCNITTLTAQKPLSNGRKTIIINMGQVMNNLPLQPLKWSRTHSTRSALHIYFVRNDSESDGKYEVRYREIFGQPKPPATGFATIDEAKAWAWKHYNEKMQPYVKPSPTWFNYETEKPTRGDSIVIAWVWMGDKHTIWLESYRPAEIDYLDDCLEVYWSFSPFVKQGE